MINIYLLQMPPFITRFPGLTRSLSTLATGITFLALIPSSCNAFLAPGSPARYHMKATSTQAMKAGTSIVRRSQGLREIVDQYDVFLIDQWGVMHDGHAAYPGAVECMQSILAAGKYVILLSNSSKRKAGSLARLKVMGFQPEKYLDIITSGELTYLGLKPPRNSPSYANIRGTNVLVFGSGDEDREYVKSLGCRLSPVEAADFLLARGPFTILDSPDPATPPQTFGPGRNLHESAEFEAVAAKAVARGLPMIVSNPDIVRPGGDNDPMPGLLGRAYEEKGGQVMYVGKPYPLVYQECRKRLVGLKPAGGKADWRICAIGDSMWNDVKGAVDEGWASVLVTDGIHAESLGVRQGSGKEVPGESLDFFLEGFAYRPSHTIPCFRW